jgi:hypothetical protein
MGYNSKYTGAEVEALLDGIGDSAKAPYIIKSFTLQDLQGTEGALYVLREELQGRNISTALSQGRRILLRVGTEDNGFTGCIDTNAYEEDVIYLNFIVDVCRYSCEIGGVGAYHRLSLLDEMQRIAEATYPTAVATATQKIDARDRILTMLEPNIMYDWSGSSLVSLTIPRLSRAQAGYEHKWMVRLTCGNSSQVTIPFTVTWINGVAPSWSTWSTVEFTFTKGNDDSVIYGEYKIFS